MKFSKKASMSLSINAIVILVLAMAVLGLGLGIVKMVKQRAGDLNIDVDLSETADSTNRIANLGDTFELRANKPNDLGVSFYNTKNECERDGARIYIDCGPDDAIVTFDVLQAPAKIDSGTAGKLIARITPKQTGTSTVDIKRAFACDFQIYCAPTYDTPNSVIEHKSVIIDVIA